LWSSCLPYLVCMRITRLVLWTSSCQLVWALNYSFWRNCMKHQNLVWDKQVLLLSMWNIKIDFHLRSFDLMSVINWCFYSQLTYHIYVTCEHAISANIHTEVTWSPLKNENYFEDTSKVILLHWNISLPSLCCPNKLTACQVKLSLAWQSSLFGLHCLSQDTDPLSELVCIVTHQFRGCRDLGRVVRKPVNVNPGLNVNWSAIFSCVKMFFTSDVWCSLRLLQLKTEGQTI